MVRTGGVELHLGVEEPFRPARKARPGVLVDDLDNLVARLQAAGFQIVWDADRPAFDACTSISVMDAAIRIDTAREGELRG